MILYDHRMSAYREFKVLEHYPRTMLETNAVGFQTMEQIGNTQMRAGETAVLRADDLQHLPQVGQ